MDNFKFTLFSILIISMLASAGYWAFSTIETGSTHVDSQIQRELEQKNEELIKEVAQLKKDKVLLELDKEQQIQKEQEAKAAIVTEPVVETKAPVVAVSSKYQSLINDLQKLINNNTNLKIKSQGTAVGTVQKFLNIYNNTSNKVDNDYGASTVTAIKSFQKAEGLTVDGEAGPNVFKKMITWLKSH